MAFLKLSTLAEKAVWKWCNKSWCPEVHLLVIINFCLSNMLSIGLWITSPGSLRKSRPKELTQIDINPKKFHSRWHVLCSWAAVNSYDISLCSAQFFSKNILTFNPRIIWLSHYTILFLSDERIIHLSMIFRLTNIG